MIAVDTNLLVAVVTNPRIFSPASPHEQALAQVEAWLASPRAHVLHSGSQHWTVLSELTRRARFRGEQFHDARIAAICIENGGSVLWSADRDFGRLKSLRTLNPLV